MLIVTLITIIIFTLSTNLDFFTWVEQVIELSQLQVDYFSPEL